MNSLVVYFSLYGNTRRVAEAIGEALRRSGTALVVDLGHLSPADLAEADLVVLGSPTHIQNVPKAVRATLAGLPRKSLAGKGVAAFDTSLKMWRPLMSMTAAHGLLRRMRKLGGKSLVRPETFLVKGEAVTEEGETDLLYDGELERAAQWAEALLARARPAR